MRQKGLKFEVNLKILSLALKEEPLLNIAVVEIHNYFL